jgi:hypothetical protein
MCKYRKFMIAINFKRLNMFFFSTPNSYGFVYEFMREREDFKKGRKKKSMRMWKE